ncbi:protein EsaK [Aeromonas veronii]
MINPLNITIEILPGPCPRERMPPDLLTEHEHTRKRLAEIIDQSEVDAAALLAMCEVCLVQAKKEAADILDTAREEARLQVQAARESAAEEAVQWLCSEQEIERLIAAELCQRWRHITAHALEELLGDQDQNSLLLRRIEHKVAELLPKGSVKLYLSPDAMVEAIKTWGEVPEFTLHANETLSKGQAILDNGLVRIHLDNAIKQSDILRRFRGSSIKQQA